MKMGEERCRQKRRGTQQPERMKEQEQGENILWKCISDKTGLQKAKITQGLLFLISLFRRAHGKMTETCHVMWQGQERNTAQFFFKAIKTPGRRHLKEICKKEF